MNRSGEAGIEAGATGAAARIRAGALTSVELVTACLDRIEQADVASRTWAEIDRDTALDQAREMDSIRQRGLPVGVLHGVPVAVDEVFGGRGRRPVGHGSDGAADAFPSGQPAVVERLKEAGMVVAGRTRTTAPLLGRSEHPINPHDARCTAGGPCGGGAAAVGACQVPLAVSLEAQGGIVLSASFCGAFGFRPTRGVISRRGACFSSPTLAQVGILGRSLEDVACLADVLGGYDAADAASYLRPRPRMREGLGSKPPVEPDFIWLDMPYDDRLSAAGTEGFEELRDSLGEHVVRLPAPAWFGRLPAAHRIINEYESATWWRASGRGSDASLPEIAERGFAHGEDRYRAALTAMEQAQGYFAELFHDYDAVIAPAAAGEAPSIESGAGDSVFCEIWALCGLPSLCVPLLEGEAGLPVGVQLIGSANGDDRLLRSAGWLIEQLLDEAERPESESAT